MRHSQGTLNFSLKHWRWDVSFFTGDDRRWITIYVNQALASGSFQLMFPTRSSFKVHISIKRLFLVFQITNTPDPYPEKELAILNICFMSDLKDRIESA